MVHLPCRGTFSNKMSPVGAPNVFIGLSYVYLRGYQGSECVGVGWAGDSKTGAEQNPKGIYQNEKYRVKRKGLTPGVLEASRYPGGYRRPAGIPDRRGLLISYCEAPFLRRH